MVRDSVLACLSLPMSLRQLFRRGKTLQGRFAGRPRKRIRARTKWSDLIF
jgi:hypothetical protein